MLIIVCKCTYMTMKAEEEKYLSQLAINITIMQLRIAAVYDSLYGHLYFIVKTPTSWSKRCQKVPACVSMEG